jgi:predicted transposase/invertase (TIGR01784 family)
MARDTIDHDRLFKELISTFFLEFLQLFLPRLARAIDPASLQFLDKELFTDVSAGQRLHADIVVRARENGRDSYFLIHLENQAQPQPDFPERMFRYFARLSEKHRLPVYPIVVFSHDALRPEPREFRVRFPDLDVLRFRFHAIQLRRLRWRDFVRQPNPVAAALMAKMGMRRSDRPWVKVQCLRLLTTLQLDPARLRLISGFVDAYLRLSRDETLKYEHAVDTVLDMKERSAVMKLTTSWMEEGRALGHAQGRAQGHAQGRKAGRKEGRREECLHVVQRQLHRRVGPIAPASARRLGALSLTRLEALAEAILDFTSPADFNAWLSRSARPHGSKLSPRPGSPRRS